ncbi:histidinol dehydrogenase [Dielma fastidiosa]|uniref:Histidinol dehydrogenase n=1 Tax=Dielma fastidiosa TaxID=1034346 RepID=A0AB35ULU3_9FIRM|nr:histidinol dehydrogenase [Dielma fastidiosa]MDY5167504.1 histidinol dehydrogenase [Dielma fastidiosa]
MLERIKQSETKKLEAYLRSRSDDLSYEVLSKVQSILSDVRQHGDEAIIRYTKAFDGIELTSLRVSDEALNEWAAAADEAFKEAMAKAKDNIIAFHEAQKQNNYLQQQSLGICLGQRVLPLEHVGVYVPGGRAQYPSSVLMNVLPAKIAGVKRIVMITPPSKSGQLDPKIAYAAQLAGVDEVYLAGGAQGIAALAYGSETIPRVDKIVGPGNIYVAAAKKLVYGTVDIDMIAGPSEILVIADEGARADYTAADLLSQAEHDPMASAILVTTSSKLADQVCEELKRQSEQLPKHAIIAESLKAYGKLILCETLADCVEVANAIAPEHLELMVADPWALLGLVRNAGSVFLGYYTCESVGDYLGGTNHVLPTNGTARFASALSVDSFVKRSSFLYYSKEAIEAYGSKIVTLAESEDLQAHANAVKVRM